MLLRPDERPRIPISETVPVVKASAGTKARSPCSQLAVATIQLLGVPTPLIAAFHHAMLERSVPLPPASNSTTTLPSRCWRLRLRPSRTLLRQNDSQHSTEKGAISRASQPAISTIFAITVLDVRSVNSIVHAQQIFILFQHYCDGR